MKKRQIENKICLKENTKGEQSVPFTLGELKRDLAKADIIASGKNEIW